MILLFGFSVGIDMFVPLASGRTTVDFSISPARLHSAGDLHLQQRLPTFGALGRLFPLGGLR